MQPVIKRKGSVTAAHTAHAAAAASASASAAAASGASAAAVAAAEFNLVAPGDQSLSGSSRTRFGTLNGSQFNVSNNEFGPASSSKPGLTKAKSLHTSHSTSSLLKEQTTSGSSVAGGASSGQPGAQPVFSGGNGGSYNSAIPRLRSGSYPRIQVPPSISGYNNSGSTSSSSTASNAKVASGGPVPPIIVPETNTVSPNEVPSPIASVAPSSATSIDEPVQAGNRPQTAGSLSPSVPYNPDAGIKVYVRIRPLNQKELQQAANEPQTDHIRIDQTSTMIQVAQRQFCFDSVMGMDTTQEQLYEQAGVGVVDSCVAGYNASILAYGQTGSGKTFTMSGPGLVLENANINSITVGKLHANAVALESNDQRGLIPRVLERLFDKLNELCTTNTRYSYSCTCSFLEIYNERIQDLLAGTRDDLGVADESRESDSSSPFVPGALSAMSAGATGNNSSAANAFLGSTEVSIRKDGNGEVHADNLTERAVDSPTSALVLLQAGNMRRKVGSTLMNAHSSRSHTVLTLNVVVKEHLEGGGVASRISRLNLVDLAGSENAKATGCEGKMLRETANINKSLTALGYVIMSIVTKQQHIPYRNSKLTYLLKDAFGGNSCLCLIANVAPTQKCITETLYTLAFASNARKLPNRPFIAPTTLEGVPQSQLMMKPREGGLEGGDVEQLLRILTEDDTAMRASLSAIVSQVDSMYQAAVDSVKEQEQRAEHIARLRRQLALLSAAFAVPLDASLVKAEGAGSPLPSSSPVQASDLQQAAMTAEVVESASPRSAQGVAPAPSAIPSDPPSLIDGEIINDARKTSQTSASAPKTNASQAQAAARDAAWLLASPGACWPGAHERGLDDSSSDSGDDAHRYSFTPSLGD